MTPDEYVNLLVDLHQDAKARAVAARRESVSAFAEHRWSDLGALALTADLWEAKADTLELLLPLSREIDCQAPAPLHARESHHDHVAAMADRGGYRGWTESEMRFAVGDR
jgi:hypothetical protein